MVNLTNPELEETKPPTSFPPASEEALWDLRSKACASTKGSFTLQGHQRFLRRVLSPDSPTRSMLVVHGTGTGKTCTAIQVAEEYILRPEFQSKKVLIIASAAVQENFRDQIFDMSRVSVSDAGVLESKQCTGRRYLEMLQRSEKDPKNWKNAEVRDRLERTADRIISEFYEFTAYASFGNLINEAVARKDTTWIKETFSNRLIIVDEAHNIRPKADVGEEKAITAALEKLVKTAEGITLVLLTATPMYESYEEILLYFNLFLWNDRLNPFTQSLMPAAFFKPDGTLKDEMKAVFQGYCQTYVSYVKGENPFTFPFRLPPPTPTTSPPTAAWTGEQTATPLQYLSLVASPTSGVQAAVLKKTKGADTEDRRRLLMQPTVAVLPNNADFEDTFREVGEQYAYTGEPFLGPSTLAQHSAKFASVIRSIEAGEGIAFVYSNYVSMGAVLFAMALEEHGYSSALGSPLLQNPSYSGQSKGKYALLTSTISEKAIAKLVNQARSERNRDGSQIRVIITSPLVSEGVDFRCVRQAHILDPWWNMSRIEQVIGRSLRTCSHTLLTEAKQNCTVYLHVVRTPEGAECYDEYTYRTKVEPKAIRIARVRAVLEQSAMDCPFRIDLPEDWERLVVHQERSEGHAEVAYRLEEMLAPSFLRDAVTECTPRTDTKDASHVRPLSSVLDVRDELLDKMAQLLVEKPIWDKADLVKTLAPYSEQVIVYTLQKAIQTGYLFRDAFNRKSVLESRGDLYALLPTGVESRTLADRTLKPVPRGRKALPEVSRPPPAVIEVAPTLLEEKEAELALPGDAKTRFSKEVIHGYIFDHLLTESEKIALLRRKDVKLPFADRLRVPGTSILIRGLNQFDPPEEPIGEDRTRVDEWTAALADKFSSIIASNTIFTSLADSGKFTISKVRKVSPDLVVRAYAPSSKTFLPTICGTGVHKEEVPLALAKTIDKRGVGIPDVMFDTKTKKPRMPLVCVYCELLAREEHGSVWLTPEELSILYGDPALRTRFTAEFKKTNPP